jgi:hypothetical protein
MRSMNRSLFKEWDERARALTAVHRQLHGLEAWFRSPHNPPPRWNEIRMTNVEGIPKSEDQMEHQQVQSRRFGFQDSDFFRHWSFVIRISVASALRRGSLIAEVKSLTAFSLASWRVRCIFGTDCALEPSHLRKSRGAGGG